MVRVVIVFSPSNVVHLAHIFTCSECKEYQSLIEYTHEHMWWYVL